MTAAKLVESKPVTLTQVKAALDEIQKRDTELGYRSTKVKDFLETFPPVLSIKRKEDLYKKIDALGLTRIREEQIVKIIDFLPQTADDLRVVLAAYPLSLPKKDQDAIVSVIGDFSK